ncbi:DUF3226 domain-containing protein [Spirulina subsalsa]|uniref:DUF3226 domain-containing protein n=1 Tax=Spirulina subsalsa TaxID=54311 RepID=UPI000319B080|nr:DUF3226 domain-containing protein [Spirulina subsalsa]
MNILIVESENDEYFIEALIQELSSATNRLYCIDEYKHSNLEKRKLVTQLSNALIDAQKAGETKIGIILDLDDSTRETRLELINECLKESFADCFLPEPQQLLTDVKKFVTYPIDDLLNVKIACFFNNVGGQGELEDILRQIKSKDSVFADCLYDGWKNCLIDKGKKIEQKGKAFDLSEKELLKLWVDFYKRFDTLERRKRNYKNTDWKGIMLGVTKQGERLQNSRGKDIFNLNSPVLLEIKSFLQMFD